MSWLKLLLLSPLLAALLLGLWGHSRRASAVNIFFSLLTLIAAMGLSYETLTNGSRMLFGTYFFVDAFNVFLVSLTAFVAFTTAIFSGPYMLHEIEIGRIRPHRLRLYHCMYQLFIFAMLLALTTNNLGLIWISLEMATLATVLLVSLYRTPASISAAWKYFIICGVGIAIALFGTILIFSSSSEILGHGNNALTWTELYSHAAELKPNILELAFVFLLIGYGTKVGLFPMHTWLPDAHAEGPTPVSAVLSGLLLNVALYALVRCKTLVDGATHSNLAGELMMAFGIASLLVAALSLHQQRDIKRMFSFSSIEHMGLMTFAFGIGAPLASFAALLHMTAHSLVKSGIFFTVGHAAQAMGTQQMTRIRGLIRHHPGIGWGLLLGTIAISGFPPFGVFTSEFLVFSATLDHYPWLVIPLLLGLVVAFAGLLRNIQPAVFGEPAPHATPVRVNMLPIYIHLGLALALGIAIPGFLSGWYDTAAQLLSGVR